MPTCIGLHLKVFIGISVVVNKLIQLCNKSVILCWLISHLAWGLSPLDQLDCSLRKVNHVCFYFKSKFLVFSRQEVADFVKSKTAERKHSWTVLLFERSLCCYVLIITWWVFLLFGKTGNLLWHVFHWFSDLFKFEMIFCLQNWPDHWCLQQPWLVNQLPWGK